jgi:adenine specific DNA methylase Mod
MGEIFGEENYVSTIIRRAKVGGGADNKQVAKEADYVMVFAKNKDFLGEFFLPHTEDELKRYSEKDNIGRLFWDTYFDNVTLAQVVVKPSE